VSFILTFRIRATDADSFFTALKLILFNVFLCLEATPFFLILPDVDIGILNYDVVIVATLSLKILALNTSFIPLL